MKGLCLSLASSAPISLSALPQCIWTLSSSCPVIKPQLWDQLSRAKWYVSSYIQLTHIHTQVRRNLLHMTGLLGGKKTEEKVLKRVPVTSDPGRSWTQSHRLRQLWDSSTGLKCLWRSWDWTFVDRALIYTHMQSPDQIRTDLFQRLMLKVMRFTGACGFGRLWYIHKYLYVAIRLCPGVYHTTSCYRSMKQYTTPSCQTVTFIWTFVVRALWPREWAV